MATLGEIRFMKPYSEMTEQEAKEWFGLTFKRPYHPGEPESYVCEVEQDALYSGYGVLDKEYDPYGKYDINEVKQYLIDYPEMECEGWIKPLTQEQRKLLDIRTVWNTTWTKAHVKQYLYNKQKACFKNDDLWNGDDIDDKEEPQRYLITWGEDHISCDRASALINQYAGMEDDKAEQVRLLRNAAKQYISDAVDAYWEAHYGKPETPVFPVVYVKE